MNANEPRFAGTPQPGQPPASPARKSLSQGVIVAIVTGGFGALALFIGVLVLGARLLFHSAGSSAGPSPTPPSGVMNEGSYEQLFLDEKDLPAGLRRTQDSRDMGPEASDTAFVTNHGQRSGLALWTTTDDHAALWRVVDIRWTFPTAADAAAYHHATLAERSEGNPEIKNAAVVGSECRVFGGKVTIRGVTLTHYFYLFRAGSVVVKLYAAEGPRAAGTLHPSVLKGLGERIVGRVQKSR